MWLLACLQGTARARFREQTRIKTGASVWALLTALVIISFEFGWCSSPAMAERFDCSTYSPAVFNMAPYIIDDVAFTNALKVVRGTKVPLHVPRLMRKMRNHGERVYFFRTHELRDVASGILSAIYLGIRPEAQTERLNRYVNRVGTLATGTSTRRRQLFRETLNLYKVAATHPGFSSYLERAVSVDGARLPSGSRDLLSLARNERSPDSVAAQGRLLQALEYQTKGSATVSLSKQGLALLHRNRVYQDMLYLGYSCEKARQLASNVPQNLLSAGVLRAESLGNAIHYFTDDGEYTIPFPEGITDDFVTTYSAKNPLNPATVPDLTRVYQGEYRSADFAIGRFDFVSLEVSDPITWASSLNLIRAFPGRHFQLYYSPSTLSRFGISNMPEYVRQALKRNGLDDTNITFEARDPEKSVQVWLRDVWLIARNVASDVVVRLRDSRNDLHREQEFAPIDISTEGGAHFPVGRYHFLNPHIWRTDLPVPRDELVTQYKARYQALFGREPVLLNYGTDNQSANEHVDLYLIFLPQADGKPAVGVADPSLGGRLLEGAPLSQTLRGNFLMQLHNQRLPLADRLTVSSFEPARSGMPAFVNLWSHRYSSSHFLEWATIDSWGQERLDAEALWLQEQGFTVFRFPIATGMNPANGIVELSDEGARFTTVSWGSKTFDEQFAGILGRYGYSVRFMPGNSGIFDGAGYHCLTNESRLP